MDALFFNVEDGYAEAIVRGYKSGILSSSNYINLTQCETLDGKLLIVISVVWVFDEFTQTSLVIACAGSKLI